MSRFACDNTDLPIGFDTVTGRLDVPGPCDRTDPGGTSYFAKGWDPMNVVRRPIKPSGRIFGPSLGAVRADDRVECDVSLIGLTPDAEFVAAGCNRSPLWEEGGSSRLPGFEEYLGTLDPAYVSTLRSDFANGIDCLRFFRPGYVEAARPSEPAALAAMRRRSIDGHRNSRKMLSVGCTRIRLPDRACPCHVCFSMRDITSIMIESGAMRCLGLIEDVQARGEMPAEISPLTIEPKKPR